MGKRGRAFKKGKKGPKGKRKRRMATTGASLEVLLSRASRFQQEGRLLEARQLFEEALERFPDFSSRHQVQNALGTIYLRLKEFETARQILEEASKDAEGRPYPPGLYNLALASQQTGRFREAAEIYERLLALDPRNAMAWNNLALARKGTGDLEGAAEAAQRAVFLEPKWPEAWNNLAVIMELLDRLDRAEAGFKRAIELRPGYLAALYNLGCLHHRMNRFEQASKCLRKVLDMAPEHKGARFILQSLGELEQPEHAPAAFVKETFDTFAEIFEHKLKKELAYRTPEELYSLVRPHLWNEMRVLDLGCGTGLGAEYYRPFSAFLAGMDCSEKMLEKARQKGLYDELFCNDILRPWPRALSGLDLVYSSDCLVYFGNLARVFSRVHQALRPGGLFAFSVENLDDTAPEAKNRTENGPGPRDSRGEEVGWQLHKSGRFAHSEAYIRSVLAKTDFELISLASTEIRREAGRPVKGMLVAARRARQPG